MAYKSENSSCSVMCLKDKQDPYVIKCTERAKNKLKDRLCLLTGLNGPEKNLS